VTTPLVSALEHLLAQERIDLARLALAIARVESPNLDDATTLGELARIGARAADALTGRPATGLAERLDAINRVVFELEGFRPNKDRYDDMSNNLLHVVVEQRTGIPISLAVVYMTIARHAGIEVFGVSFPGHFLLRVPREAGDDSAEPLVLDPFGGGRMLSPDQIRTLLAAHAGADARWDDALLSPATSRQIAVRMLHNLKRAYVGMRSFPQAWQVADALVAIGGRDPEMIRDRGLLAYHLDDFTAALSDLETYVQAAGPAREGLTERDQIWEHLSTLRRRVASLN
jgi:regulator of sirC expression with transglutaminase-like and TPR domain